MKRINKLFLLLALPLSISLMGVAKNDGEQKIGNFDVVSQSGCSIEGNKITASSGSFVLKNGTEIKDGYSLKFNLQTNEQSGADFGIVLYGQEEDGKLTGDSFKTYFYNGSWQLMHGTLDKGVFSLISTTSSDFGSHFTGNYEFAVEKGMMALKMDDWVIGTFDLVFFTLYEEHYSCF